MYYNLLLSYQSNRKFIVSFTIGVFSLSEYHAMEEHMPFVTCREFSADYPWCFFFGLITIVFVLACLKETNYLGTKAMYTTKTLKTIAGLIHISLNSLRKKYLDENTDDSMGVCFPASAGMASHGPDCPHVVCRVHSSAQVCHGGGAYGKLHGFRDNTACAHRR